MVLGALLVVSAVSYYAKQRGIPVEEVLSWTACSCVSSSGSAHQAMVDDAFTEDYDLLLQRSGGSSYSDGSLNNEFQSTRR